MYVEMFFGRSLAALQGNPESGVNLWVPQSPGKVGEEVTLQWGLELIKGTAFTGRDT